MKSQLIYLKKLELFKELDNFKEGQFFAVADSKVKNHLPQWISFSPHIFWLKNPEEEKTLEIYGQAIEFFLKQGITRSSTLYAIGGGATTDFGGFVASTVLRGIKWCAIPTTLLGMIDGSIGGKVAVNMPQGKNLVGNFHAPEKVFISGEFLTSLPSTEWMSGKGEVIKYGFLSKKIYDLILKKSPIDDIALACAQHKELVVEKDFLEQGERILLNLGHSLGHAFEYSLKIPHGHAVAMGLKYLFSVMKMEECTEHFNKMVKALDIPAEKLDLHHYSKFNTHSFFEYLEQDKKKVDSKIRLVLVKDIGVCYVEEVPLKEFKLKIQAHADFKD